MKNTPGGRRGVLFFLIVLLVSGAVSAREETPRLKVLTFNVWGIVGAEASSLRLAAIGRKIATLDPDIVVLEEAFTNRDRAILFRHLAAGGYEIKNWRYVRNLYGTGLLFISRYWIQEFRFEPYRVQGGVDNIEWLGGKGIIYARLQTPWGPLDFFHTHAIARMTDVFDAQGRYIPGDPLENDRLLQMYQFDRYLRRQRGELTRSLIAAGDFNVSPEMLEYHFLLSLSGLENAFDKMNPGQNPSTYSVENVFVTQECSRIDHIFFKNFSGTEGFGLKPVVARLEMMERFTHPADMTEINYSDHYGLLVEFEVIPGGVSSPSPEGVVPLPVECRSCPLVGYEDGVIELTPGNLQSWQNLALKVYSRAWRKEERTNPLLLPMAQIVAANPPVKIWLLDDARLALEKLLGLPPPLEAAPPSVSQ